MKALSALAEVRCFFATAHYLSLPMLRPRGYLYEPLPPNYTLPGVNMEPISYPALPILSRPLNGFVCERFLLAPLRRFEPDIILAYWIYPEGYAAARAAARLHVPCVIGARGSDVRVRDRISKSFTRLALQRVSHVITVSDELRERAITDYGVARDRATTIINGCDTNIFHPRDRAAARASRNLPIDAEVIVFVGRLVEAKGIGELVAAFATLRTTRPRLRLVMVGDGVDAQRLTADIAQRHLSDCVQLTGAVPPAEVAGWIAASNALCLPSYSEGYPNVLVESLACGVPVVASDVGGAAEIVNPHTGVLVQPRNVASLVTGIEQVLSTPWDPALLAARYGRSWSDVAKETLHICEAALADSGLAR